MSVVAVDVAALPSMSITELADVFASAAIGVGGGVGDDEGENRTGDALSTPMEIKLTIDVVTKVSVTIPDGVIPNEMINALHKQLCGPLQPPACKVVTPTATGRRQLAELVSFDFVKQLDTSSDVLIASPAIAIDPASLAQDLNVNAAELTVSVGESNIQATVVVVKEGSAISADAASAVTTQSAMPNLLASLLGLDPSNINVMVEPSIIAPPKPPPTPPPPLLPPLPPPSPPLPSVDKVDLPSVDKVDATAATAVTAIFTLSGSIADYAVAMQDRLRAVIATGANVGIAAVSLSLQPASVVVTATIAVGGSSTTAAAVKSSLEAGIMKDSSALQAALAAGGISAQVESAPLLLVSSEAASSGSSIGLAAGAAGGGLAVLAVILLLRRHRQRSAKQLRRSKMREPSSMPPTQALPKAKESAAV